MKRLLFCIGILAILIGAGCVADSGSKKTDEQNGSLPEQIAREFETASPLADPGDARARDAASAKLAECNTFKAAAGNRILWGGCEPVKGFDPRTYTLTEFEPLVWLKLYASTIMFTGEHEVRQEGGFTVLEMKARFRSQLDAGDYPYPFWHSPKKWQAYQDLRSLALVFQGDKLLAAYRIAIPDPAKPAAERAWDGKWMWTDEKGEAQPRVALFNYMFANNNPHRAGVERTFRELEAEYRSQNCTSCHAPDNKGKAKALLILNFPNQSLTARHELVDVLKANEMPPADAEKNHPAGIANATEQEELIRLAKAFVNEADAAFAFESAHPAKAKREKK